MPCVFSASSHKASSPKQTESAPRRRGECKWGWHRCETGFVTPTKWNNLQPYEFFLSVLAFYMSPGFVAKMCFHYIYIIVIVFLLKQGAHVKQEKHHKNQGLEPMKSEKFCFHFSVGLVWCRSDGSRFPTEYTKINRKTKNNKLHGSPSRGDWRRCYNMKAVLHSTWQSNTNLQQKQTKSQVEIQEEITIEISVNKVENNNDTIRVGRKCHTNSNHAQRVVRLRLENFMCIVYANNIAGITYRCDLIKTTHRRAFPSSNWFLCVESEQKRA